MNIALYSPYAPGNFGGGEKHFFDIATQLAQQHQVTIASPALEPEVLLMLKQRYETFLGYSLDGCKWQASPLHLKGSSVLAKLDWTKKFDYLFSYTDGSTYFSAAKRNNLHFQVPLPPTKSLMQKLKLHSWQQKNANSHFTQAYIEREWGISVPYVLYPLIREVKTTDQPAKQRMILVVGRFFKQLHSKRQDVIVDMFAKFLAALPAKAKTWKLVLVGEVEDQTYYEEVVRLAKKLPVEFKTDCSRVELMHLYSQASFFWHAAGNQVDEVAYPHQVEHFGIATLEAMAAGAIPLVVYKGGQAEILTGKLSELGWQEQSECVAKTIELIADPAKTNQLRQLCIERSRDFGQASFTRILNEMVQHV